MPDKFSDYYYLPVSARAEIGGADLPITSLTLNYALDAIPTAEVDAAVGRDMLKTFNKVSAAHGKLSTLTPLTPFKIYMKIDAEPSGRAAPTGKNPGFPPGSEFLVFDGFMGGPVTVKSTQGDTVKLSVLGFGFPTLLSGSTQFVNGITTRNIGGTGEDIVVSFGAQGSKPICADLLLSVAPSIKDDIWGKGISPIFREIIKTTDVWSELPNNTAEEAMTRLDDGATRAGAILKLSGKGEVAVANFDELFDRALAIHMSNTIFSNWAENSGDLWDILIALSRSFYFHIVPLIDADIPAPLFFGLGGDPHRVISPAEYWTIHNVNLIDPKFYAYLGQVGLVSPLHVFTPFQNGAMKGRAVGVASLPLNAFEGNARGRFKMETAPSWMVVPGAPATPTVNPGNAIPDASNPDVASENSNYGEKVAAFYSAGMGNGAAGTILQDGLFEHRGLTITGRLRMDIAPGSLIRVDTVGERFAGMGDSLFGHVISVKVEVESGGPNGTGSASTTLGIRNVRSQAEHDTLTAESHPLYLLDFKGIELSEDIPKGG